MRGSVYYQSSQLVKQIFKEGAKKEDKINRIHEHYEMVSSYQTMESYRSIWNNFFNLKSIITFNKLKRKT